MNSHTRDKRRYLAFRDRAREMEREGPQPIRVSTAAAVQPCADGAFVDCVIWVPAERPCPSCEGIDVVKTDCRMCDGAGIVKI